MHSSPATAAAAARSRRRMPWRDNIEAMTVAIVMAVFLKYFIVEAYKIPTGSMQPTLMGETFTDGDGIWDRILVDKLSFHYRDPERWEVVVFRYPLDRSKNFVKRLVGMPEEELRIQYGDLWARTEPREPFRPLRRPRPVQLEMWKPLDLDAERPVPSWRIDEGQAGWTGGRRSLKARGDGRATFTGHGGGPIRDQYTHGYPSSIQSKVPVPPQASSGMNPVGDLRVSGEVEALAACTAVTFELSEGGRTYSLVLPGPSAPAGARARIVARTPEGEREELGDVLRLPAGAARSFSAQNLDDLLTLEVGGEVVCELEIEPVEVQDSAVRIRVQGEGADLDDLQVWRDIFFTPGGRGGAWRIPAGSYFMMGDNTQNSSDSREWAFVNLRWTQGEEQGRVVRGNWRPAGPGGLRLLESNPIRHPSTLGEPLTWLRDEWGELHVFPTSRERPVGSGSMLTEAPFVPRELIVGRAVLVFWPLSFSHGVYRLKWVH